MQHCSTKLVPGRGISSQDMIESKLLCLVRFCAKAKPDSLFPSPFRPDNDMTVRQAIIMGDTAKIPVSSLDDVLEYTRELAELSVSLLSIHAVG